MSAVLRTIMRTGPLGQACGILLYAGEQIGRSIGACVLLGILASRRLCSWASECLGSRCG